MPTTEPYEYNNSERHKQQQQQIVHQNKQVLDLEHAHKNWWQIYEWLVLSFVLRANALSVIVILLL